jgi:hypothetical protein
MTVLQPIKKRTNKKPAKPSRLISSEENRAIGEQLLDDYQLPGNPD